MDNSNTMDTLNQITEEKSAVEDHTINEQLSEQLNP